MCQRVNPLRFESDFLLFYYGWYQAIFFVKGENILDKTELIEIPEVHNMPHAPCRTPLNYEPSCVTNMVSNEISQSHKNETPLFIVKNVDYALEM